MLHVPCEQLVPFASVEAVQAADLLHTGCTGKVGRGAYWLHPGEMAFGVSRRGGVALLAGEGGGADRGMGQTHAGGLGVLYQDLSDGATPVVGLFGAQYMYLQIFTLLLSVLSLSEILRLFS